MASTVAAVEEPATAGTAAAAAAAGYSDDTGQRIEPSDLPIELASSLVLAAALAHKRTTVVPS